MIATALRYWHTLRWLKPVQWWGRLRLHLPHAAPSRAPAPPLAPRTGAWIERAGGAPQLVAPATLRLLDVEHEIATGADWNDPAWPDLWIYQAHYFDDLRAVDSSTRKELQKDLVARWLAENPPLHGRGWDPYPMSRRCVNWIAWDLAGNALDPSWRDSLAVQLRALERRVEWHLLGNHLWTNAKALVFGGLYFDGGEAGFWRTRGLAILERELDEQVLPDGGHFERSTMYHAFALEDLLDLINLAAVFPGRIPAGTVARWRDAAARMLAWLRAMTHPDGEIALFKDSAFGQAPSPATLAAYAQALDVAAADVEPHWWHSGYLRLARGPFLALLDVGSVAPSYLPGHAHADTLAFELSVAGARCLVDSGCSTYAPGPERLRQRGTAAHNTVVVDGADSSEVWASFRVARRARVRHVDQRETDVADVVYATHDGYRRLPGAVTHARRWTLRADALVVEDTLDGRWREAQARFHLHPDVQVDSGGAGTFVLRGPGFLLRVTADGGALGVEDTTWHPRFGASLPARCLVLRFAGAAATTRFELASA